MSEILSVDDSNFDELVLKSNTRVLVDFSATWCGPCQKQHIILAKFAAEASDQIKVVQVDIDEASKIAATFRIRSVPTLMLFVDGKAVGSKVGLTSYNELVDFTQTGS